MATPPMPPNVHVSSHPCLLAKLSQLRSRSTQATEVGRLVHSLGLILASEALATVLRTEAGGPDETPLGQAYETVHLAPARIVVVPVLRSGLAMVEAVQTLLPAAAPVHHLGLYREPATLAPVEYYNNLPAQNNLPARAAAADLAIVVDPVIATGGTCCAVIQTLRDWGARRVIVLAVLGHVEGVRRCAHQWPVGTDLWLAAIESDLTPDGMLSPGLGDIGDRLFRTNV